MTSSQDKYILQQGLTSIDSVDWLALGFITVQFTWVIKFMMLTNESRAM